MMMVLLNRTYGKLTTTTNDDFDDNDRDS